jgi:hypothetical protein
MWELLASGVVLAHLATVAFIVAGGFLSVRWPRAALVHLPFAIWGVLVQLNGWICPLTPIEVALWRRGGGAGYEGAFLDRYVFRFCCPEGRPRHLATALGLSVLAVNLVAYGWAAARLRRRRRR